MKKENLIIALAEYFGKTNSITLLENTEGKTVYWGGIYTVVLDFNKDAESVTIQFLPEYNEIYEHTYCYNDPNFMTKIKKDFATFAQDVVEFYEGGVVKHE